MPAGHKLDRKLASDDPCWDLHSYRSAYTNAANTRDGYFEHMGSLHRRAILETSGAYLLAFYLPGICLLYGAGVIVAWVVKGFRPQGVE